MNTHVLLAVAERMGIPKDLLDRFRSLPPAEYIHMLCYAIAEKRHPFFRNRTYQFPGNYISWTNFRRASAWRYFSLFEAAESIAAVRRDGNDRGLEWMRQENSVRLVNHLECYDYPFYLVEPELAVMVHKTDIDPEIKFRDVNLPFPAVSFLLPDSCDLTYEGVAVQLMSLSRRQLPGEEADVAGADGDFESYATELGKLRGPATLATRALTIEVLGLDTDGKQMAATAEIRFDAETGEPFGDIPDDRLFTFAIKLLVAMESEPEIIVDESQISRRPAKKGKRALDVRKPRLLSIRRWYESRGKSFGTHASPHMHVRRGHMRRQAYGSKMSLRKNKWIMPTWVARETKDEQ